jgi:segregation and condensation protein A
MEEEKEAQPEAQENNKEQISGKYLQVYTIATSKDPSWQNVIYDLINTEQLDPWDLDIAILCKAYFDKLRQIEDNNFYISSQLLLAAALLLRIKSQLLLEKYITSIDEALFGKKEDKKYIFEKIIIDENEIPILSPKTPLPRFKKVTLQELIDALDVAIKTESRRITKEIQKKQAERMSYVDIPKFRKTNIRERIRQFYAKVLTAFKGKKGELKLPYSHFTGVNKEERVACFLPMLHLSNHGKLWIEQEKHYDEIYVYLFDQFKKAFPDYDKQLIDLGSSANDEDFKNSKVENHDDNEDEIKSQLAKELEELEKLDADARAEKVEVINKDFENPLANLIDEKSE